MVYNEHPNYHVQFAVDSVMSLIYKLDDSEGGKNSLNYQVSSWNVFSQGTVNKTVSNSQWLKTPMGI